MKKLKTIYSEMSTSKGTFDNTTIIDNETGEVLDPEIKRHKIMVGKDQFYLTYTYLLNALSKDLSLVEMKVYAYLLEHNNAGAEIGITKKMKESICAATNISHINSISNALKSLQEKELPFLFKSGRGTYILNPRYAYQGSTKNRDKHLKAIIDLGCINC